MQKKVRTRASRRKWFKLLPNRRRKQRRRRKAILSITRSMPKLQLQNNKPLHPTMMRVCKHKRSREMLISCQLPFNKSQPNPVQRLRKKLQLNLPKI